MVLDHRFLPGGQLLGGGGRGHVGSSSNCCASDLTRAKTRMRSTARRCPAHADCPGLRASRGSCRHGTVPPTPSEEEPPGFAEPSARNACCERIRHRNRKFRGLLVRPGDHQYNPLHRTAVEGLEKRATGKDDHHGASSLRGDSSREIDPARVWGFNATSTSRS